MSCSADSGTTRLVAACPSGERGSCMKKTKKVAAGELRPEYIQSDFGALVRGKYVEQLTRESNAPQVRNLRPSRSTRKHG